MPLADPLARFQELQDGQMVRLTPLKGGRYRIEVSQDEGETWTSFEAGQPGHVTAAAAIEEGGKKVDAWKAARKEAEYAEIVAYFNSDRLERRTILVDGQEARGYAALTSDGEWIEGVTPAAAIGASKARQLGRAAERGATQGGGTR